MVGYDYKSGGEEKRVPDISKTYYGLENRIITLNGRIWYPIIIRIGGAWKLVF